MPTGLPVYLVALAALEAAPQAFHVVYGALFGAALGSFLGCAAYRLPRRLPLGGRSRCPACGTRLRAAWMVPVVSWIAFGGRARCCGARLSVSYLLLESSAVAAGALAAALAGVQWVLAGVAAVVLLAGAASAVGARRG